MSGIPTHVEEEPAPEYGEDGKMGVASYSQSIYLSAIKEEPNDDLPMETESSRSEVTIVDGVQVKEEWLEDAKLEELGSSLDTPTIDPLCGPVIKVEPCQAFAGIEESSVEDVKQVNNKDVLSSSETSTDGMGRCHEVAFFKEEQDSIQGSRVVEDPCYTCCKIIKWKHYLAVLMRQHPGENLYLCGICGSRFSRADHLKRRKWTHTGEKPYKCNICESRFNQASNLNRHKRIHTGEKPFVCEVCASRFSQASELKKHKQTHTGEKPYIIYTTHDNISITSNNATSSLLNCQNSEANPDTDDTYNDPHFENELSDYIRGPSSDEENEEVGKRKQASTNAQEKCEIASTSRDGEDPPKKIRRRTAKPDAWKDNISKKRRNRGESYTSKRAKTMVSERKVRPGCGEKCQFQCTAKIDSHVRFRLFQRFWGLGDIDRQRNYISRMIEEITPRYRYPKEQSSRKQNVAYYFRIDGQNKRVCRKFFTATLDISPKMIYTAREKVADGVMVGDLRGKHRNHKKLPESVKEDCRAHIRKLNRIESHYLRAQTEREYVEGGRSIAQIYRDYVDSCRQEGKQFASRTVFFDVFDEFNISFYVPKKDQCEVCVAYENSNHQDRQEEHAAHLEEKKLSRIEKEHDKSNTDKSVIVCTYDLQAAFPTPKGDVSVFYYRSKLATYNMTVYDIKERIATCNVWHEGEGNRGEIEISTSVFKFIQKKANEAADRDIEFIFYSDNCTGQQKNKFTIMMYMFALCLFENIKAIQHKFLIKGHTQNEADSVHSLIEKEVDRALKVGPIFVPAQYYQIMKTAKKNPPYHQVNELTHRDFIDFKGLTHLIGENFTVNQKNETFPFGDLKVIKVCQDNPFVFQYKTTYQAKEFESVDTNWSKKKRRSTRTVSGESVDVRKENLKKWTVKKAYNGRIPIAENKKRDLKYLVDNKYIKPYYADFYNNLL